MEQVKQMFDAMLKADLDLNGAARAMWDSKGKDGEFDFNVAYQMALIKYGKAETAYKDAVRAFAEAA